jgi:hypothetical protein
METLWKRNAEEANAILRAVRNDSIRLTCNAQAMESTLTANPSSPGYDYLAVGPDVPIFARWAHGRDAPLTLGQEAAEIVAGWLDKYRPWPRSRWPLRLTP